MQQYSRRKTDILPEELHALKPENRRRAFWLGMAIIAAVAIGAILWTAWGLKSREHQYVAHLQKRLELLASSQVQMVDTIVQVSRQQADRVIRSELFKLYATEIDLIEDRKSVV